jgi:IS605 OrfB family transposase
MKPFIRTYETRISVDSPSFAVLLSYAELFAKVEHHLLKKIISNADPNACKREFLKQFGITGRQYNACKTVLQGKIDSIKEKREIQITDLEDGIKILEAKIKKIKNPFTVHQKKRRISHLKKKLAQLKEDKSQNKVRLCFGSKQLFRAQFSLKENGYSSHKEWREAWKKRRHSDFFVLGSKDELNGNQSCTAYLQKDGSLNIRLRLPNSCVGQEGSYLWIRNVFFAYGHKEILMALTSKQALCYRFKLDEKGWRIFLSVNTAQTPIISDERQGAIGVDINSNHLSIVETDRFGNVIGKQTIPLNLYGKNSHQSKALIGNASKKIVSLAESTKKPIVLEKLNFKNKKKSLKEQSTTYARMLSSFAYSSILTHIKSRAHKQGIEIKEVNPAYTSIIGRVKFSKRYGLSVHHAAALVIARRSLRFSEKPPSCLKDIPDGRGGHVALPLPVRNRVEHVWTLWRKLAKKFSVALVVHFRAIKYRSTYPQETVCVM